MHTGHMLYFYRWYFTT